MAENNSQPAQAVNDVSDLLPPHHWAEVAEGLRHRLHPRVDVRSQLARLYPLSLARRQHRRLGPAFQGSI
ncbi:hypothetical protein LB505_002389 [Fusarium chuoi]|nr:hypothetical protein LB505_002389 [Fusarium chuoi]